MTLAEIFALNPSDRNEKFNKVRLLRNDVNAMTFDIGKFTINWAEQIFRMSIRKTSSTSYSVTCELVRLVDSFLLARRNDVAGTTEFTDIMQLAPNSINIFNDHFDPSIFDVTPISG